MLWGHVPVVEPTPIVVVMMPAGTTMPRVLTEARPTPAATISGAVDAAVKLQTSISPAAADASEALAPVKVVAVPSVPSALHRKVEAVVSLAVTQTEINSVIR